MTIVPFVVELPTNHLQTVSAKEKNTHRKKKE
jgi:hypothetical protein